MEKLPKIILLSLIFACIGITTEVVFTSMSSVFSNYMSNTPIDWALSGKTYLWMFFIYAAIPLLFKLLNPLLAQFNMLVKALITILVIYIVEFSSGLFLELTTGSCPWKYTEGWHVFGFIRLDYFPFWFVFALIIINVYTILDKRLQ